MNREEGSSLSTTLFHSKSEGTKKVLFKDK
jgi:hypothetical protein